MTLLLVLWGSTTIAASVEFLADPYDQSEPVVEEMWGEEWKDDECRLWLSLEGIVAVREQELFMFGSLSGGWDYRSVLLYPADGGYSWREVMQSRPGSAVLGLRFVGDEVGWALTGWTVEGPGDVFLFRTLDGGLNWDQLPVIPKPNQWSWPIASQFRGSAAPRLGFVDCTGLDTPSCVLETDDSGAHWRRIDEDPKETMDGDQLARTFEPMTHGPDGSDWRTRISQQHEVLHLERRFVNSTEWQHVSYLPTRFLRERSSQLLAPCGDYKEIRELPPN